MKKTILTVLFMACAACTLQAIKPIETEGFDKFNNAFKLDLVSSFFAPQIEWEHYTDTRFSYGVSFQVHFRNRASAKTSFNDDLRPTRVNVDGTTYDIVGWHNVDLLEYAIIKKNDNSYDVKWDRKYVGVMVCPEGRFYFGRKPDRGFYFAGRVDMGVFSEMFDIFRRTENNEYLNSLTVEQKETDPRYQYYIENTWNKVGVEKGETFMALGVGGGLGFQGWFKKNSHWGFDLNCLAKSDWKFSNDENTWEWFWGVGSPIDANLSIIYRF